MLEEEVRLLREEKNKLVSVVTNKGDGQEMELLKRMKHMEMSLKELQLNNKTLMEVLGKEQEQNEMNQEIIKNLKENILDL